MFKVSIIIPTYKRPYFLNRALKSIFKQNPQVIQVIVIDDCEHSSAQEVASNFTVNYYSKRGIKRGVSESRNIGIQLAVGQFILFLDDDDFLIDGAVDIIEEKALINSDFIFFNFVTLIEEKITLHDLTYLTTNHLLVSNHIPIGSYLISRRAIKSYFDSRMESHEDWLFLLENILDLQLIHIPIPVVLISRDYLREDSRHMSSQAGWALDFLAIYARFPAIELRQLRHLQLKSLNVDLPEEFFGKIEN